MGCFFFQWNWLWTSFPTPPFPACATDFARFFHTVAGFALPLAWDLIVPPRQHQPSCLPLRGCSVLGHDVSRQAGAAVNHRLRAEMDFHMSHICIELEAGFMAGGAITRRITAVEHSWVGPGRRSIRSCQAGQVKQDGGWAEAWEDGRLTLN